MHERSIHVRGRSRHRVVEYFRHLPTARLLSISFLGLIVLGTIGLKVLPGLYTDEPLGWLDALFTATSAVCVTGLIVVDTATHFTTAGQAFLLVLIQLGGLGIITFTTVIIASLGGRLSLGQHDITHQTADIVPHVDHRRLTGKILLYTFVAEIVGAALLYLAWLPDFGWSGAWWPALFHSISAFCNAGFSVFSDSLTGYSDRGVILTVIMMLITIGGLGFLVIDELLVVAGRRKDLARPRISTHSRLVLWTSGTLVVAGWLLFSLFEWNVSFSGMATVDRVMNGLFMSVTARTAGFNTVDYNTAANNSDFLTILLMAVGGSPGSAAGGLKTTTIALIGLLAWAKIRGERWVSFRKRTIPDATVQQAVGLFVIFSALTAFAVFAFTTTEIAWAAQNENSNFLPFLFEAVSALNTVGLSMGVTGALSDAGRVFTIILMFVGRVGPLTVASALASRGLRSRSTFRDATEDVAIG